MNRDAKGRFVKGNQIGKGRREGQTIAYSVASVRKVLQDGGTDAARRLVTDAKKNWKAAQALLNKIGLPDVTRYEGEVTHQGLIFLGEPTEEVVAAERAYLESLRRKSTDMG